jgi:uncharacterized protein
MTENALMEEKYQRLISLLKQWKSVCVAFSAGVDSSFLLDAAHRAIPGGVMAVTVLGSMVPARDAEEARAFCAERGIRLVTLQADEFTIPEFAGNVPERCYYCKKNIFSRILQAAHENGIPEVVEGSNADDLGDYRPGMRALAELGIRSPMLDCGLAKAEIRALARRNGVAAWDKPAGACLATRVPFGTPLTPELLGLIERAEYALSDLGFSGGRVRVHDALARIELPVPQMKEAVEEPMRTALTTAMRDLGFRHVCLDLEGYVKGSMNRAVLP